MLCYLQIRRLVAVTVMHVLFQGCQYTMRIINADGSEAEMCGNGIRCLAMFVKDDINIHKSNVENNEKRITCSFSTLAGKIVTEVRQSYGAPGDI